MTKHVKPTKEELEANAMKAAEEAEAMADKPDEDIEDPKPSIEPPEDEKPDEKVDIEPSPSKPPEDEKPSEDYKKKFVASSREALVLHSKNKKINEAVDKADQLADPTEEERRERK